MSGRTQTLSWQGYAWARLLLNTAGLSRKISVAEIDNRLRSAGGRFCIKSTLLVFVLPVQLAWAVDGIATDGTMGLLQALSGVSVTVPQSIGTTVGTNLFHSFSEFNISTGQTVTFTGADNLQNVFSRVTGTDVTNIDGTLKSSIANAAFYFINPNGITFGENARVDVPGAFHVGTADKIDFLNNGAFYANGNQAGTLSSDAPAAFGFLDTSAVNNGLIEVDGSHLTVGKGQTLDMAAGEISIENDATVSAPAGEVRLEAVGAEHADVSLSGYAQARRGSINIDSSVIDSSGDGAGKIAIRGGEVTISGSGLLANNSGDMDASIGKGVDIEADILNVKEDSGIRTNVSGQGRGGNIGVTATSLEIKDSTIRAAVLSGAAGQGGNILVNAKNFSIDKSTDKDAAPNVSTESKSTGAAGSVAVIVTEQLTLRNQAYISSDTYGAGSAGSVNIASNRIELDSKTQIESSAWKGSTGNAGEVSINTAAMNMNNGAWIYSTTLGTGKTGNVTVESSGPLKILNGASIQNYTFGSGDTGNITVNAGAMMLDGQGASVTGISSNTYGSGKAGNVTVKSAAALDIINGAIITSNALASGDAGNITVNAATMTIDGGGEGLTGIYSETFFGSGKAGDVTVGSTGSLDISNGAIVGSSTMSSGNSGNVYVKAGSLKIDAKDDGIRLTGIYSGPASVCSGIDICTGKAGLVDVESADTMDIVNGGSISNSTFGDGDAGRVSVKAGTLKIEGSDNTLTGIYANSLSHSAGKGGNIDVESHGILSLLHGGVIDTSTYGTGKAGDIAVKANTLQVGGLRIARSGYPDPSGIFSAATSTSNGQAGNINIIADNSVHLFNHGKISIENNGVAIDPGKIEPDTIIVTAPDIEMSDSEITGNSTGNVAAGNIVLNFSHWLTMDPSFISTTANTGNGGAITINGGGLIYLENSGFRTTVSGADSNGGDILTQAELLGMNNGVIQANAVGGSGGNINLNLNALIPSGNTLMKGGPGIAWQPFEAGFNVIQAASQAGVSGAVNVTAPQLNLSGIIANLGGPQFDSGLISQDYCGLGTGSSLTRKGAGGLKPKSGDQLLF